MIDLVAWWGALQAALQVRMDAAEQNMAKEYEYADVRADLLRLLAEVQRAQSLDVVDAANHWRRLELVVGPSPLLTAQRALFNTMGASLRQLSDQLAETVNQRCEADFGKHADVPARLMAEGRQWQRDQGELRTALGVVSALRKTPGWEGEAEQGYVATVQVQAVALKELCGIMESASQGCQTGATLNRAIFYVVAKSIRKATSTINGAGGGGPFHRRTQTTLWELNALLGKFASARNGSVAAGSANNLASQMVRTVSMPNLLQPGSWPSGMSAAGVLPARTDQGVTADGSDANLRG